MSLLFVPSGPLLGVRPHRSGIRSGRASSSAVSTSWAGSFVCKRVSRRGYGRRAVIAMTGTDTPPTSPPSPSPSDADVDAELDADDVVFDDEVQEPYPGFFADMKRTGMSDEEARAQAIKATRQSQPVESGKVGGAKSLYREDGTPYAPWMSGFPEKYDNTVIKSRTDATGRLAADPQLGELSGVGLTWRIIGDNDALELAWATGAEDNNRGFVVYRRQGKSDKWDQLSDYRSNDVLKSKGPNGGAYRFSVPDPQPGTWVYRVSDVDENENVADLAQVLVDVESPEDSKIQKIALAALVVLLLAATAAGVLLDPRNAYS